MKYKKLSKAEQLQLQELVDRAEANDQPLPIFNIIGREIETPPTDTVSATLAERGSRYGDFRDHARLAQRLQDCLREHTIVDGSGIPYRPWDNLTPVMKQALTVDADKNARILNGDPTYADNWHDKQGYAKLVEDTL
jgi:hypothetical protein